MMLEMYGPHSPKIEMINGYKAARARINAAAIKHCEATVAKADEEQVAILQPAPTARQIWRKRQEQAHSTPQVWFNIVEELNIRPPTILEIQQQVADYFEVRRTEIVSTRRAACLVLPRHISFYLCRKLTPCGFPMIAKHCGRRDHTTAIHAYQKIAGLIERGDKEMIGHIQAIKTLIERRRS